MRTYYIYNGNDEFLGTVKADNVVSAEYKAYGMFPVSYLYALTTAPNEALA